ncbi:FeoA family protein [Methylobacterium sp. CG08_land_8_20_14_0_20_71_15]|uniref:FeoA family protein n=1 Tax=Methylobacterium sp. CG08_land_8_20_14_0_20_71_15 TaxID=1975531 RepID=UPI000CAF2BB2|nr:MAG: ferrous iron transport protein A [Methylobacterium sp. CG08_land_8_20_14_0_20_71_15]
MRKLLVELREGESGIVVGVRGGFGVQRRLATLGIRINKKVRMITAQPFRGPVVVEVDRTHIAIGLGMAWKVLVEVAK